MPGVQSDDDDDNEEENDANEKRVEKVCLASATVSSQSLIGSQNDVAFVKETG